MLLHPTSSLYGGSFETSPTSPLKRPTIRSAFSSPSTRTSTALRYDNTSFQPTEYIRRFSTPEKIASFVGQPEKKDVKVSMSDDGTSTMSHEGSEKTASLRRKKKTPRASTSYVFASPAPTIFQKQHIVHLRRPLLQIQELKDRPVPVLDILPSTVFVPRLAKKFPMMFKGKGGLGPNDILVVKSEKYDTNIETGSDSDDDSCASRLEAVICQGRKGEAKASSHAEIVFISGAKWIAVPLSKNIYEISHVDEYGMTTRVRWVRGTPGTRSRSDSRNKEKARETKFSFTILEKNSRKHPILAKMSSSRLDIHDFYKIPSPALITPETEECPDLKDESTKIVSEFWKRIVRVTGVWVALHQGWSPNFKYEDYSPPTSRAATTNNQTPTSSTHSHHGRSASLDYQSPPRTNDFGMLGVEAPESTQGSLSSNGGRYSCKMRRISGQRSPKIPASDSGSDAFGRGGGKPQRSISAGTQFMAKVAAKRMTHPGPPSTVTSDSEQESLGGRSRSPPLRERRVASADARFILAGASGNGSNLSVGNEDGSSKRFENPSPLGANVETTGDDRTRSNSSVGLGLGGHGHWRANVGAANLDANATSGKRSTNGKGNDNNQRKKTKWARFSGLFKRSH